MHCIWKKICQGFQTYVHVFVCTCNDSGAFKKNFFLGVTIWLSLTDLVQRKAKLVRKRHSGILVTVDSQAKYLLIIGNENKFKKNIEWKYVEELAKRKDTDLSVSTAK